MAKAGVKRKGPKLVADEQSNCPECAGTNLSWPQWYGLTGTYRQYCSDCEAFFDIGMKLRRKRRSIHTVAGVGVSKKSAKEIKGEDEVDEGPSEWLVQHEDFDEEFLLASGLAKKCRKCKRATSIQHLERGRCPDCEFL